MLIAIVDTNRLRHSCFSLRFLFLCALDFTVLAKYEVAVEAVENVQTEVTVEAEGVVEAEVAL